MAQYIIGLDLGKATDNSAIAVLKHTPFYKEEPTDMRGMERKEAPVAVVSNFTLVRLEKVPLGTPYPRVVEKVAGYVNHPKMLGDIDLVVDTTGVGSAIYDYLMEERGVSPIGVITTGGEVPAFNERTGMWSLPKKDLVAALVMLYQTGRLVMNPRLENLVDFRDQLQNFSSKISRDTGHTSYEAMTEAVHDDLVIAVALAGWWAGITSSGLSRIMKDAKKEGYDPRRFSLSSKRR